MECLLVWPCPPRDRYVPSVSWLGGDVTVSTTVTTVLLRRATRTCRTRRASAGATGFVRGCAGVPRAAAAAAAAPGSAVRAAGFWVLAPSCAGAGALSSRCARAALALRSRLATHTPASGEPAPWAVHDDGSSSPSSSLPSCCHCVVVIHSKLGLPHYRPSPPLQSPPTRTPRGLAARSVPARARRARAMGVPASRALQLRRRLRRRRLLARRLLGVGVLVRWRAARCATSSGACSVPRTSARRRARTMRWA